MENSDVWSGPTIPDAERNYESAQSPKPWWIRWRIPTSGGNWGTNVGTFVASIGTAEIKSLVFDPYSDSLFAATSSDVYRIDSDGNVSGFLTGLNYSGGGMTFTYSGILVVSESDNLLAVDGWRYVFNRGDVNGSLTLNMTDVIYIADWLFNGGAEPECWDAADVNDDSMINLSDAVYLANHLYSSGPEPPPPFDPQSDEFGVDPTADFFGCRKFHSSKEIDW
jgi:hypothetical protein